MVRIRPGPPLLSPLLTFVRPSCALMTVVLPESRMHTPSEISARHRIYQLCLTRSAVKTTSLINPTGRMKMRTSVVVILAAVLIMSIAACQDEIGPPGPQGPAGAAGPAGPPGPAGESMAIDDAMIETLIAGMQEELEPIPPKWEPDEYTQYFVKEAIRRYNSEGLDATVDYYNSEESVDGQWYVFILDQDDIMLAHAVIPALVGRPASEAVAQNNYPAGEAIVSVADEDGAWFSFEFPNPVSGIVEAKHSWSVEYDGLTFGSGWYERGIQKSDAPAYTKAFVQQAMNLYDAIGLEQTVTYYNTEASMDGQWYVFIADEDDVMLAHAARPDFVGLHASETVADKAYPAGKAILAVADDSGGWISYNFTNPETGIVESKHTWAVEYDGLTFGSGWYERGPQKTDAPAYTKAFVQQAISLYDAIGREDTLSYYNSKESADGQWYIFIVGHDGRMAAHYDPQRLGLDVSTLTDPEGRLYGPDLMAATDSGTWVNYVRINPETGEYEQKQTWVVLHDGLIFGSGWYE